MRARLGLAAVIGLALAACGGGSSSLPGHQPASHATVNGAVRAPSSIQAYSAAVLADSPIVYYRTNETSGTTAADSSGHGYGGTYGSSVVLGNANLVTGDVAPTFPGGTSSAAKRLKSSTNAALAPTGAMSIEFWVNVPATVSTTQILFTQSFANGNSYQPVYISLDNGSPAYFTLQINTSSGVVATYPTAVLGAKNHVVLTWTGTTLKAYVNGVASGTATGSGSLVNYASPYAGFTLGGPVDAHTGFAGSVGEFALYGTALSAARVTAHYNAAINPDPTPPPSSYSGTVLADAPVAYYRMNETSGTTAADSSGHGYNGTYGSSVALGGAGLVPGDTAPTFPGGTASAATVLRSSANTALAPTGAMSAEFWVNVPATVSATQILFTQSFANGNAYQPVYISLDNGSPAYFTLQINTSGGVLAAYPAAVLGAKNHVVLTWTGTTLTAYVNGVASSGGTGSGSLVNYASPYTGFTVGGPVDAHTGFSGSLGEFALYNTALSAARVQAHYNAGTSGSAGTVVWQTGGGSTLGQYVLPAASDGQCAGVGPVINGNNATFTSLRNTNATYNYNGTNYPGASTCYRNQMNPIDPNTGTNFMLANGTHYTFTFQTVVTLNGNVLYQGAASGGLAVDIPAIVWQTHSYGGPGGPCDLLVIGNTYVAYANGLTKYGVVAPGGQAMWNFHTCDETDFTGNAYNSPDTLHDGQVDNWQIDITAETQGQGSPGSVVVQRNGSVVYNAASHTCDSSTTQCWWNFGAYTFYYESSEEPPGWNNAGITVQFNNMKLVKT
jgi:hypothetical protein